MKYKRKNLFKSYLRYTPLYKKTFREIQTKELDEQLLINHINKYIEEVPYYHKYKNILGESFNIKDFPIIRKPDIQGHETEFVSTNVNKRLLIKEKTGGSTGWSLTLFRSYHDIIQSLAYVDYIYSLIGKNLKIAVLRGNKPKKGLFERISSNKLILSSYSLSPESLETYLDILRKNRISCIHAYPSSISILARLIKNKYGTIQLPDLKGILTSSEIFSREEKLLVSEVFPNVKIVDFYAMSERSCCAYSIGFGNYHFLQNYGYTEFIDTGEKKGNNHIAEIVATSIMNTTMPFIRYGTEDYVEIDNEGNIIGIIGRSSDFIINKNQDIVPCIVLTRNESKKNVINFQFYQEAPGILEYRAVVSDQFTEKEREMLTTDLINSFDNKMTCKVTVVSSIERTKLGKQKRLIQKLDLSKY